MRVRDSKEITDAVKALSACVRDVLAAIEKASNPESAALLAADPNAPIGGTAEEPEDATEGERDAAREADLTVAELREMNKQITEASEGLRRELGAPEAFDAEDWVRSKLAAQPRDAEGVQEELEGKGGTPAKDSRAVRSFKEQTAARRSTANGVNVAALRKVIEG